MDRLVNVWRDGGTVIYLQMEEYGWLSEQVLFSVCLRLVLLRPCPSLADLTATHRQLSVECAVTEHQSLSRHSDRVKEHQETHRANPQFSMSTEINLI